MVVVRDDAELEIDLAMDDSRPSTPIDAPPQDLWSSILDSVSSTRSTPSKQVLVLGAPSSGKSLLASALLHKPAAADDSNDALRSDFALGYDWADVRDDADEGASVAEGVVCPSSVFR